MGKHFILRGTMVFTHWWVTFSINNTTQNLSMEQIEFSFTIPVLLVNDIVEPSKVPTELKPLCRAILRADYKVSDAHEHLVLLPALNQTVP